MPVSTLARALYLEEVARARAMDPEQKLLEGPRLFERACRVMADGVRYQFPQLDDDGVAAVVAARLARVAELDAR
jgi:hypothetical protein